MKPEKVYLVFRNSDMIEGRGHDVLDIVFLNKEEAFDYMDKQEGCGGRKVKWSEDPYGEWFVEEIHIGVKIRSHYQSKILRIEGGNDAKRNV